MKKKIIVAASFIVILVAGLLYVQSNNLIADDKNGKKDCSSSCTDKSNAQTSTETNSGASTEAVSDFPSYEFVTDKIHCDGCKEGISGKLMGISGVKEVSYGETCNVSKMTSVKIFYSDTETSPEVIAASVKEKGLECSSDKCGDKSKMKEGKQL